MGFKLELIEYYNMICKINTCQKKFLLKKIKWDHMSKKIYTGLTLPTLIIFFFLFIKIVFLSNCECYQMTLL